MSHFHYHYEAHNKEKPDGTLDDPVTVQIMLPEPDVIAAETKASALTDRKHLKFERVLECDPLIEQPWRADDYERLKARLNGSNGHISEPRQTVKKKAVPFWNLKERIFAKA